MSGQMKSFRSLLFVPGIRPERFAKAVAAGADAVCIDLEDAVPPHEKAAARSAVLDFIANMSEDRPCAIGVRINPIGTDEGQKDIDGFLASAYVPDFLMVPKAVSQTALAAVPGAVGEPNVPIWAVIETVEGLLNTPSIARACSPNGGVLFGGADFSAEIGTAMSWEPLFYARSKLAAEVRIAPLSLMDVPFLDVHDGEGLRHECERVRALGYDGKACIHPNQVAIVNEVFSPNASSIAWAQKVARAQKDSQGGAVLLEGKLLDAPLYLRAQRILVQAGLTQAGIEI
jgi:citrate lyase beta subunit